MKKKIVVMEQISWGFVLIFFVFMNSFIFSIFIMTAYVNGNINISYFNSIIGFSFLMSLGALFILFDCFKRDVEVEVREVDE